jgi:hypothetical protein
MSMEFMPPTKSEKQRSAWFVARIKPGMSMDEYCRLNEAARRLFPVSEEERRLKTESLMAMPEFVL